MKTATVNVYFDQHFDSDILEAALVDLSSELDATEELREKVDNLEITELAELPSAIEEISVELGVLFELLEAISLKHEDSQVYDIIEQVLEQAKGQ